MENLTHFVLETPDSIQTQSTLSKNFFKSENFRAMMFSFAVDEELTEHSSKKTAILHVLSGTGTFGTDKEVVDLKPNAWIHIPADLKHWVKAKEELHFLLYLIG